MNNKIWLGLFIAFCAAIFILALRGIPGNPDSISLNTDKWRDKGPMELSPERGRFALLYSVVEDRSAEFSLELAKFATPDIGYFQGKYVSLFAPGVSFLIIPGYLLGKVFGLAQVGAFAAISLFALFNILLIYGIAQMLGANKLASSIAAAAVVFGSPAFAYGVTLYQHHVSAFLILASLYLLLRWNNFYSLTLIWLLIAASIPVDYPNLILMLPIGLAATFRIISLEKTGSDLKLSVNPLWLLSFIGAALPLAFFMWFNQVSYQDPLRLGGTVPSVQYINEQGLPDNPPAIQAIQTPSPKDPNREKKPLAFFQTRNMLNGFYIHAISPDRGIIFFAPVVLFGILGLILLRRSRAYAVSIISAVIGLNILLYSMWGDPAGGWAFGSRYLIPSYLLLGTGMAYFLSRFRKNYLILALFFAVLAYSVWVNALGAVSTSLNPPRTEILELEKQSGLEEKYTYERNLDYLKSGRSKSLVYKASASNYLTAAQYHLLLSSLIIVVCGTMLFYLNQSYDQS